MLKKRIVIAGGGAAGFFAAIAAAEADPAGCDVLLLEATAHVLGKVKVSGGGRCNVTHSCFEPRELAKRYPRGGRELLGAFHRWQPRDTVAWFSARGVELKTEADGRMFPFTDDSQTVVDCLIASAERAGVRVRKSCGLKEVVIEESTSPPTGDMVSTTAPGFGRFRLILSSGETVGCDRLLLATGGNRASAGFVFAARAGHAIEPLVPSLFTFHVDDSRIKDLAGVSVLHANTQVWDTSLRESGPLLITHWGFSGPAILKLSAWGARELHAADYRFFLTVDWTGAGSRERVRELLVTSRATNPRKQVVTWNPFGLPQRLWERLIAAAGIAPITVWTSVSNEALGVLADQLSEGKFQVTGKSLNKEEFVTCGGVRLSEVEFKTMESRLCPGLYFAGEILDIDGITGGFNFQAAWTTGWLAGQAMAREPARDRQSNSRR